MTRFRLLDTAPAGAAWNMALDEVLTRRAGRGLSPPTLRFLQFWPAAALVGHHQDLARELRLDYCAQHGIEVNRRLTGGGALLFQESALGWEIIAPQGSGPFRDGYEEAVARICTAAADGLSRLGIKARFRPRNDIEVAGRKISGTGGMSLEGGMLFQGTVLVKNQIERFLKALRVPVEKLKKREIESLMERMVFLEDLVGPVPLLELKAALAAGLSQGLGLELSEGRLSAAEEQELAGRLPFYQSPAWIDQKRRPCKAPAWLRTIYQAEAGTLMVHLWPDLAGRRVQKALITGDFFSRPQRLVMDLEAALLGRKIEPARLAALVEGFLTASQGELVGIAPGQAAAAVAAAAHRLKLARHFSASEAAEIFLVGLDPGELEQRPASWLLLPYCCKPTSCDQRFESSCDRCGQCQMGPLMDLGEELGLRPVSVQSFEHLMATLHRVQRQGDAFVGSCCEAFYTKHQREMEASGAQGVLVNLDSTTCYDLGKGMAAYSGHYDNQTYLNQELIGKVARVMAHG